MKSPSMFPAAYFAAVLALCTLSVICAQIGPQPAIAQSQAPPKKSDEKNTWKILRASSTNACLATVITAVDPNRPEKLGEYKTKKDAMDALDAFKKQDDPKKAGYKMCE